MKAAVLTNHHTLELREVPCPEPGPGEALIRVAYTGICGSDVHLFTGKHPLSQAGMILGHEFSGTVAALGQDCGGFQTGDKVCAHIIQSCGGCDACKRGYYNLCRLLQVLGTQADGAFAEYVKVRADKLFRLPENADLRVYALAEPLAVGVYATDRLQFKVSDTALVIGAGPIGLCCALAAQKAGASRVVISEVVPEKIEFARSFGFEVIDAKQESLEDEAARRTGGMGFDRIYETSGAPFSTERVTRIAAVRAGVIMVAYSKEPRPIDTWDLMRKEIRISSIRVHTQPAYEAAIKLLRYDASLRSTMMRMITRSFDFADIQQAFEASLHGTGNCKIMVRIAGQEELLK